MLPSIERLNSVNEGDFADALSVLFERAPRFLVRLAVGRPFGSYDELLDRAQAIAATLPDHERVALVDGHPRIGADPTHISALSYGEQGYDRRPAATGRALAARLAQLNDDYERRFGFRFVVFVAGRPRSEIAELIQDRLKAPRDVEMKRALSDVLAIARDRVEKLVPPKEAR